MSDTDQPAVHGETHGGHGAHEIHMPPNSWSPIVLSITLMATFIGFLVGPWLWIIGLGATIATCYAWVRSARTEFLELPD